MIFCIAPSQKANHPTDVILKVEADARPIKTYKTGKKQDTHAVSHSAVNTVLTVSRNSTKSETSETTLAPSKSVTRKTTPAVSHNPKKGQLFGTKSILSPFPLKDVTQTTLAVSRNRQKGPRFQTTPAHSLHPLNSVKEMATPTQSFSLQKHWSSVTQPVSQPVKQSVSQSLTQSSQKAKGFKYSSTQSIKKETQGTHLYTSPSPVELGAHNVATKVLSTSRNSLKKEALNRTVLLTQDRSETLRDAFLNSTVKVEPSTQVNTKNIKTKHSIEIQPSASLASMFNLRGETSLLREFQSEQGSNQHIDSEPIAMKTDNIEFCRGSPISQGISPPSGTAIALGPVTDMRTCIHLSCEVDGDVAYMRSLQCFVITCDSSIMCKPGDTSSDNTSQVAFLRKRSQSDEGRLLLFHIIRA